MDFDTVLAVNPFANSEPSLVLHTNVLHLFCILVSCPYADTPVKRACFVRLIRVGLPRMYFQDLFSFRLYLGHV